LKLIAFLVGMFGDSIQDRSQHALIGAFDAKCDIRNVVEDAAQSAQHLCEKYYLGAPEVEIEVVNGESFWFFMNSDSSF
jgi:hypothetical protein